MTVITDTQTLAEFCARQHGADFIAVDTEFMRERTYWPILCLVQVAGPQEAVAVDALAPVWQRRRALRDLRGRLKREAARKSA